MTFLATIFEVTKTMWCLQERCQVSQILILLSKREIIVSNHGHANMQKLEELRLIFFPVCFKFSTLSMKKNSILEILIPQLISTVRLSFFLFWGLQFSVYPKVLLIFMACHCSIPCLYCFFAFILLKYIFFKREYKGCWQCKTSYLMIFLWSFRFVNR